MRRLLFCFLLIYSLSIHALDEHEKKQILQRVAPVGKVRVKGQQESVKKQEAPSEVAEKKAEKQSEPGQKVYEKYCAACHRSGLAGAPKFRNKTDWKPKLADSSIDELTATAIKGINAMPPKGTCMDCSEAEIKAAIQYMLPKS